MLIKRRIALKSAIATLASISALFTFPSVFSAWPKAAFDSKNQSEVLKSLYGSIEITLSDEIKIKVPDVAENGSTVPINISTEINNVESISIVVPNNPSPLAGVFDHGPGVLGYVSTRIKMSKSGNVIAVVKSNGRLHIARKQVKVTLGGCGG